MTRLSFVFLVLSIFLSSQAWAFPELVRRGYANCVTCHVSPSGGGLLTAYGRAVTSEVLTMRGSPEESKFLYGAFNTPEWFQAGGDFRALETYTNFNGASNLKTIFPMQADLEASATVGKFTFAATGGVDYDFNPISRSHYVLYHPTDELYFRAGKFMPAYGINTEDHAIAIKRGIGKDQSTETYNVEASYIAENFDAFITGILGRPDTPSLGAESGVALSSSVFFSERFKVGASYYYGYRDIENRHVVGPFAILGLSPHMFILAEIDYQILSVGGSSTQTGLVDDIRFDVEVVQGLHFYLTQEYSQLNTSTSFSDAYGIGAQFFPRPHIELNTLYQKQRIGGSNTPFGDFYWLLAHYYL